MVIAKGCFESGKKLGLVIAKSALIGADRVFEMTFLQNPSISLTERKLLWHGRVTQQSPIFLAVVS